MRSILLGAAMLLPACSTLDRSRPTFEADPAELGVEGLIYQNELSAAYVRIEDESGNCQATRPSFQEAQKWSYRRYGTTPGKTAAERFACLRFTPIASGAEGAAQVARHLNAGFALSDLYCRNYFSRIALHSRKRGFWRTSTNDVGTAISGILGLASAGVSATSGVGIGFGLADGFFRNYDESFLVGPDLAVVQSAVLGEQKKLKEGVLAKMPNNFADANMAIKQHADACSFVGMKLLLNQKVSSGPTDSRAQLIDYVANFQISQDDITKAVAEKKKAIEEAKAKADEAKRLEEEARSAPPKDPPAAPPPTTPAEGENAETKG